MIPKYAKVGDDVKLICKYNLEKDILYSLKWHFNNKEFYRFVPRANPKLMTFPIKGLKIDVGIKPTRGFYGSKRVKEQRLRWINSLIFT